MERDTQKVASYTYYVEPPEGDAQGELPLTVLVKKILESATFHAETWNVGYSTLIIKDQTWVLARLAVEMSRSPLIGESYQIETWIEDFNKHFSSRNFCFKDAKGLVIGYARSIWSVIDKNTRNSVDLTTFEAMREYISDKDCPIEKQSKMKPPVDENPLKYPVRYSDIDLNRHVNSVKYIEHILDRFSMDQYDSQRIKRFEINYMNEARYGMWLYLLQAETEPDHYSVEIKNEENEYICRGKIVFEKR